MTLTLRDFVLSVSYGLLLCASAYGAVVLAAGLQLAFRAIARVLGGKHE